MFTYPSCVSQSRYTPKNRWSSYLCLWNVILSVIAYITSIKRKRRHFDGWYNARFIYSKYTNIGLPYDTWCLLSKQNFFHNIYTTPYLKCYTNVLSLQDSTYQRFSTSFHSLSGEFLLPQFPPRSEL